MTNPSDRAKIRELFEAAAACGDRYHCPPADELDRLAREPEENGIVDVAFDLMTDSTVRSFDRLGTVAYEVARAWAKSRLDLGTFDASAQRTFLTGVKRILATPSSTFIIPAYSVLDGPIGYAIPGVRDLFVAEAVNPARDREQIDHATAGLRHYTTDLVQVRAWLTSKDPRAMQAGASLLDALDHSLIKQDTDELPLLLEVAGRKDLPASVATALVEHVKSHEDNAFIPVLERLGEHADPDVRSQAKDAIEAVRQAEAGRASKASG